MELFRVKGGLIAEHRVIPTTDCGRAVDYRVDVVQEPDLSASALSRRRAEEGKQSVL